MNLHRNRRNVAPRLETLEDRTVPANNPASGVFVNGATINIVGTKHSDRIIINLNGGITDNTVNFNGQTTTIPLDATISTVNISTLDGKDYVEIDQNQPTTDTTNATFNVDLGDDNDTFLVNDTKNLVAGSTLTFNVQGGEGKDNLTANFWGSHVQDTATLNLNIDGGKDKDTIQFLFKGRVLGDVNANIFGGDGKDKINVTARFRPTEDTGGTEAARKHDTFRLTVDGGDDDDTIGVILTAQPGAEDTPVVASVNGGGGKDTVLATANVQVFSAEHYSIFTPPA